MPEFDFLTFFRIPNSMKNLIFTTLTTLLFAANSLSINHYQVGDTLFVWATSGLVLRTEPDFKADKMGILPFGSTVICQNDKSYNNKTHQIEAVPSFTNEVSEDKQPAIILYGDFIKVDFKGKTGYLFDCYLSSLKPPKITWNISGENKFIREGYIFSWLKDTYPIASNDTIYSNEDEYETRVVFKNGIIQKLQVDKGGNETYIFPNHSFEEGFLIFNFFNQYESQIKLRKKHPSYNYWETSYSSEKASFKSGICDYTIQSVYFDVVVIGISCYC